MAPKTNADRKGIDQGTLFALAKFYSGRGCVVSGNPPSNASTHHLDGDRSNDVLPNLLPVNLNLHSPLRKMQTPDEMSPSLRYESLRTNSEEHFRNGKTAQAFGCMRLAQSLSSHFYPEDHRCSEAEFKMISHCLYFLRRCATRCDFIQICDHLRFLLLQEFGKLLAHWKILPSVAAFGLVEELGSWLNELGWSKQGLRILKDANKRLSGIKSQMRAADIARFQRQLATASIVARESSGKIEQALRLASECKEPSKNNDLAIQIAESTRLLLQGNVSKAYSLLENDFELVVKHTDSCFAPLGTLVDRTLQTSLVHLAMSLFVKGQIRGSTKHRRHLQDFANNLQQQEYIYQMKTPLHHFPGLTSVFLQNARNLSMLEFLRRPADMLPGDCADLILKVSRSIMGSKA